MIPLNSLSIPELEKILIRKARTHLRRITPNRFKLRHIQIIKQKVKFWVEDWKADTLVDYSGISQGQPGTWLTLNTHGFEKKSTETLLLKKLAGEFDKI